MVLDCSQRKVLLAGCWWKSTADWLLVAGLFWEKSTAGWWLISQANRLHFVAAHACTQSILPPSKCHFRFSKNNYH
jgi:hypothetical protein